jgi:cytochrome c oxidase subunit 2
MASRYRVPVWVIILAGMILAAVALPTVGFAQSASPLSPASPGTRGIGQLYTIVFWIAAGVFVIVEGLLIFSVFRFRERSGEEGEELPQIRSNVPLEIAWTIVPALVLAIIMVLTFRTMRAGAEPPGGSLSVQVIGHQWWGEFR